MAATAAIGTTSTSMDDFSGYEFLLRKGPDQFLSTSDQCVNTAQRHFDTRDFFNNSLYSDIKITFTHDNASCTIFAHRMALHSSSYFEHAMSAGWAEETSRHLVIDGVQPEVGRAIVAFLYGQDLEVSPSQLLPTLIAVDRLMLTELEDVCCEHVHALLSPENALELAAGIADHCPSMHRSWLGICSSFIVANEEAIRATDNFKSLTREQMITMIAVRCPPIFTSPIRYVMHWLNAQDKDKDKDGKAETEAMSIASASFGIVCEARLVFWAFELLAMDPNVGEVTARQHLEDHLAECLEPANALAFVAASDELSQGPNKQLHDWHLEVCMEYVRVRAKEVLGGEGGASMAVLSVDQVMTVVGQDRLCVSEDVVFDAMCLWAEAKCEETGKGVKKFLKETGVVDMIRFPTMSQEFFHRVAEPRGVVPSRLLLERYQYHHVGNITYDRKNPRLHHRLPLQGGAGCFRCKDPTHGDGCERWIVRCKATTDSGIGFGGDSLCYRSCEFRTCAGDLWSTTVFPPGTEERELRGAQRLGMTRGDRDTAGQKLAPNEWATALKRLTNESGAVLTDCSAGLSARFDATSSSFWDLCTQSGLDVSQSSPYSYTSNSWVIWRRTHIAELNPMGVIVSEKGGGGVGDAAAAAADRVGAEAGLAAGGDHAGWEGAGSCEIFCEIHFQAFSKAPGKASDSG